ncbi:hypothetical protein COU57_04550 [Candidatus Pacearchaeota archaeon CG10_big_fil_rev_8_21_14_0_10_32_14]|nr:MAG: hypothetical protein COU57_04550 [Candidatus Pacearchaeota archaeon CG10_big_fil_rev_8_21_14_0_10_32_14]
MSSSYQPTAEIVTERYSGRYKQVYTSLESETEPALRWNIDHWKSQPLLERVAVNLFQGVFVPLSEEHMAYEASRSILKRRESASKK